MAPTNPEPGRVIINIHVDDAHATAAHLSAIHLRCCAALPHANVYPHSWCEFGALWLAQLEYRRPDEAWFGTVIDPDGNVGERPAWFHDTEGNLLAVGQALRA